MGVGSNRRATRDEQLLRDSRSDAEAFGEFYRRNVHLVLALARAEAPTAIAFDITAEVFAKALFGPETKAEPVEEVALRHETLDAQKANHRAQAGR